MARRGPCPDDEFTNLLHLPLQSWGIGRRASRLAPFEEFRSRLRTRASDLGDLQLLVLEHPTLDVPSTTTTIDHLVSELDVVDKRARIVAGTKTLHPLPPDLSPPQGRARPGALF